MGKRSRPKVQKSASRRTSANNHRVAKVQKDDKVDIDALHSALLSFTMVSGKVRSARTKRPVNEWNRGDLGQFLCELDRDLRVAIAVLAGQLGFSICGCCWPPEVLAIDLRGQVTSLAGGDLPREIDELVFSKKNASKIRARK